MRTGAERVDVAYEWPSTLVVPDRPPKIVYLDLNHWIALSKAMAGHRQGDPHVAALDACVSAVSDERAVFPISDVIYMEVSKIGQHHQRRALREVIELVSRYFVVTARSVILVHETEAMLDQLFGPRPEPINHMAYLDWGVARAFGRVGGFHVGNAVGDDRTAKIRTAWKDGPEAFDAIFAAAELELQRRSLEGPAPGEEPQLRSLGWNPRSASDIADRRAEQEIEQVKRFDHDTRWRRGRVRDVVSAREIFVEINGPLCAGVSARRVHREQLFRSPEESRRIFDAMPSFDVAVTMKSSYHRDPNHRWTVNDIYDIDALGSTIPYCDVVATDKAAAGHANRSGLADRLGTAVLSRLDDLVDSLG